MYNCPICQKEYLKIRALHAHMLKSHYSEYKAKDCILKNFGIVYNPKEKNKVVDRRKSGRRKEDFYLSRPADLRVINQKDPIEKKAYNDGYRYVANGECYTSEEVKLRRWI